MIAFVTRHVTPARLAAACTAVVFVAAFAISWESLRVLALSAGIRPLLAPLYPLTIDAVMSTGTVAAVALRSAPLRTRLYTWALIAAGIAVSVLGNAVHSQALGGVLVLPWWAAAAASAVPALSLAASLHLLVIVLRHVRQDGPEAAPASAQPGFLILPHRQSLFRPSRCPFSLLTKRRRMDYKLRGGMTHGGATIGAALRVSSGRARM